MSFVITSLKIRVDYQRKSPGGLPMLLTVECDRCSRHCTTSLRVPNELPYAYVGRIGDVYSMLCEKLAAEVDVKKEQCGLQKATYDVDSED